MRQSGPRIEGIDYVIEGGRWVFTAQFLRERGYCCENGCRNCPYRDSDAVDLKRTTASGTAAADAADRPSLNCRS